MLPVLHSTSAWRDPSSPLSSGWHLLLGAWGPKQRGAHDLQQILVENVERTILSRDHLFYHNPESCNLIKTSP